MFSLPGGPNVWQKFPKGEEDMADTSRVEPMLTVREVAQLLHIHHNTVRRWSDRGIIRTYRITSRGDRRFMQGDIARFLVVFNANGGDERKTGLIQTKP